MLSSTVMHTTSLSYNSQTKKQPADVEVSTGASLSDTLPEKNGYNSSLKTAVKTQMLCYSHSTTHTCNW